MKQLRSFLKDHPKIGLDTSIFIYHFEDHPRYAPLTEWIFNALEQETNQGVTSYLTLLEILTKPKAVGLWQAVRDYEYYLTTFPNLTILEMGLEVARKASDLKAAHRIKTPDAIQVATASVYGATGFLTNDRGFAGVKELDVALLDQLLKS